MYVCACMRVSCTCVHMCVCACMHVCVYTYIRTLYTQCVHIREWAVSISQERLECVEQFQEEASAELLRVTQGAESLKSYSLSHLEMLIKTGEELEIAIPEVDILRTVSVCLCVCVCVCVSLCMSCVYTECECGCVCL